MLIFVCANNTSNIKTIYIWIQQCRYKGDQVGIYTSSLVNCTFKIEFIKKKLYYYIILYLVRFSINSSIYQFIIPLHVYIQFLLYLFFTSQSPFLKVACHIKICIFLFVFRSAADANVLMVHIINTKLSLASPDSDKPQKAASPFRLRGSNSVCGSVSKGGKLPKVRKLHIVRSCWKRFHIHQEFFQKLLLQ